MRTELDQELCEKYPLIFADRHKPMTETCMCWGFDCGDGWFDLLDKLCANIQHHIDWSHKNNKFDLEYNHRIEEAKKGNLDPIQEYYKGLWGMNAESRIEETIKNGVREVRPIIPQVVAEQIKEKFGTLRFYYRGGDDYIHGMTTMAESISAVICIGCGAPTDLKNDGGWIHNLCNTCEKKREEERNVYMKDNGLEG